MHDIRMAVPALSAWLVTAFVLEKGLRTATAIALVAGVAAAILVLYGTGGIARLAVLVFMVTAAISLLAGARAATLDSGPLHDFANDHAVVAVDLIVSKDARRLSSRLSVFEASVRRIDARGQQFRVRAPITVFARGDTGDFEVGERLTAIGRLAPSERTDSSATLSASRLARADPSAWWWSASSRVRTAVVESVSRTGAGPAALIPALVQGDDQRLTERMKSDFRRSGLTHLLAVSGTNLTIVLVSVLLVGKACGIHGRGQWVLGLLSIAGFVLLARPDPSVVRAAGMGVVALSALGYGQRGGMRALSCAVIGLLLIDPWLARSIGFVLSVCATAGILLLAPRWSVVLSRWMPRWCALAIAVPTAAQLTCTPVIAAISGEISLIAVVANLLAGPAVAPATVLGLLGGLVGLLSAPLSYVLGFLAAIFAQWILGVGGLTASMQGASIVWGYPLWSLVVLCALLVGAVTRVFARPWLLAGLAMAMAVGFVRPPDRGWPPPDWVMVACDVGQGDATVLNVGKGAAIVVDAGPDERLVDRCLKSLRVSTVPLLVFTHNHADHTDGWPGIADGRAIGMVATGPTGGPSVPNVSARQLAAGESFEIGSVTIDVLAPEPGFVTIGTDGSALNNASLVFSVRTEGVSLLLTGDIEAEPQRALLTRLSSVHADVLKMPHHGSRYQDADFIAGLGARYATISVGAGNDYGHPAPDALSMLKSLGIRPLRTDLQGDLAIVVSDGRLWAETR